MGFWAKFAVARKRNAKFYVYTLYVRNFEHNFIFNLSSGWAFYDHFDVMPKIHEFAWFSKMAKITILSWILDLWKFEQAFIQWNLTEKPKNVLKIIFDAPKWVYVPKNGPECAKNEKPP